MTAEEMKAAWKETAEHLEKCRIENEELKNIVVNGRRKTCLEQLAARYKRFSIISFVMAIVSVFCFNDIFREEFGPYTNLAMTLYFSVCFVMDFWLYRGISSIDCQTMTVSEVAGLAVYYRKKHFQFMMVLIPMAILVLGLMLYGFTDDKTVFYAAGCGAILGLAIGAKEFINFMKDYKTLIK